MAESIITAHGVTKAFGDHQVLKGVDFAVAPGEVSCIIGPSGSGKSTFLRAVNGLETIDSGSLEVLGDQVGYSRHGDHFTEWGDKRFAEFRARIGMVFQRFNLYAHLDAVENVALALTHVKGMSRHAAQARAKEELARVGLAEHGHKKPHQLSGGQQQRVGIARALAMDPELMLFDEPTSALDPELVGEVLTTMRQLADDGMTMVIVTHEIAFAREVADTVAFFDQGIVMEKAAPADLLTSTNPRVKGFLDKVR
ncbi:amino acid ABC transporter ATP-binding protein [Brevibacterium sp. 50QC2O2]|jgi:ABC-type polar amino acid transport system ATPase subunit|uniref:amino acid ABC transporter ATP-binding protein n=1 Tax=Brevibacterium TaxID=1696 RepID=UPI00211CCD86|nr:MULTISPECIES: amino acid ABC transporter ATP-binding protein [unclassified Brevibacterium]MCQ9366659.1 amino acid ABC transporter ATP-binding protein [Brevibacterium sp. 91QC2O2]MCQ9384364.1 amino acid ABC transporter ATP-binding protein [Brevibacterium sp. 68QC2CO]MCQ9389601.1 amino acid ABC transporter ATP-binding protein [Brevibacterium sp. 50QC2O2]